LPVDVLRPEEIAAAIAFLAGPGAGYVSGITLDVNAGRSAELGA
jgi:3-oxoacyl-[acyl-carrier protein] reductase